MEQILLELRQIRSMMTLSMKDVLDINDMQIFTGLSKSRIYQLVREKRIPYYKPSGKLYFMKSEIVAWMLGNRIAPDNEMEDRAVGYINKHKAQ